VERRRRNNGNGIKRKINLVPRGFSLAWAPRPQAREKTLGTRLKEEG